MWLNKRVYKIKLIKKKKKKKKAVNDDSIVTHTYCYVLSVLLTGQKKKKKDDILLLDALLCHIWRGRSIRPERPEDDLLTAISLCMTV